MSNEIIIEDIHVVVPIIRLNSGEPWAEVYSNEGDDHQLSTETARFLNVQDGDCFFQAIGGDMEAAGIVDGAHILMRPLRPLQMPRKGDIVLAQMYRNEEYTGIIRRWGGAEEDGRPILLDGQGDRLQLSEDADEITPVAVARGIIASI